MNTKQLISAGFAITAFASASIPALSGFSANPPAVSEGAAAAPFALAMLIPATLAADPDR